MNLNSEYKKHRLFLKKEEADLMNFHTHNWDHLTEKQIEDFKLLYEITQEQIKKLEDEDTRRIY